LALDLKGHPGPLPYDVNITLGEQHLLLPHQLLSSALEDVSQINWPIPAGIVVGVVVVGLLLLRRWLEALTALAASVLSDLTSYEVNQFVRRPRPSGHGIVILKNIANYFSFPSGHVVHAIAFFGLLLFFCIVAQRYARWLLPVSIVLLLLILAMGPSRVLEGEHWPSDVVGGYLVGGFWLVIATHVYAWLARHRQQPSSTYRFSSASLAGATAGQPRRP
jgi:membrane-associated phospholipid phosphatase